MRGRRPSAFGLALAVTVYSGALVALRGRPTLDSDAGIFLSVGARLLDGDRLYADVYDNKDPLFYYAYAGSLGIGGWRAPFLLDVLWVAIAAFATAGLLRCLGASRLVTAAGLGAYPLLLTGGAYYAGYSILPGLSLAPVVCWLWARGNPGWAGGVLATALLLKLPLALVFISGVAAIALQPWSWTSVRVPLARFIGGAAFGVVALAILLALRGELTAYIDVQIANVEYSNAVLVETGREGGLLGHLEVVHQTLPRFSVFASGFLLATAVAVRLLVRPATRDADPATKSLATLFLATSAATGLTLALTAAWDHHLQILAWPGALLVALLVSQLQAIALPRLRIGAAAAAVTVCVFALATGAPRFSGPSASLDAWVSPGDSETAAALNEAAAHHFPGEGLITYAHLGQNEEKGHAVFLDERFELACRHFHQYVWSPYLHTVLRCLERERPSLVLVTSGPHQTSGRPWTEFVAGASRILRRRYVKVLQRGDPAVLRVEVWRHRSAEQEGLVSHTSQLSAGSSESPEKADDGPRTRILDL